MSAAEILEQIRGLKPAERRELVSRIWTEFEEDLDFSDEELTPEQAAELDRRLEEFEKNPQAGVSWEQVEAEAKKRFGWR